MQKEQEAILLKDCLRTFQKYNETVTVTAAVCHLFKENEALGRFMQIEPELKRISKPPLTPDLAILYDNLSKGIVFEIKWSISQNPEWAKEKIKELTKYFETLLNWKNDTGRVDWHDVILICHPDDSDYILEIIKTLTHEKEYECFKNVGFSIWTWLFTHTKKGEKTEELRLKKIYGQTRNFELERSISPELGYLVPDKVLTFLRFSYFVVKEKPPLPYLLNLLIVNVLLHPVDSSYEKTYEVPTDWIWNKAKNIISTSEEYEDKSLNIKRTWIRDALNTLQELEIIKKGSKENSWEIPTNLFRYSRRFIHEIICEKLVKRDMKRMKQLKRKFPLTHTSRVKSRPSGKESKLTNFFKKEEK